MKINVLLFIILTTVLTSVSFAASYGGGTGDPNNPYQIWTPQQLNTVGTDANDWNKCFKLMADVNMAAYTGMQYNIIGKSTTNFTGKFDGDNHVIRNFTYSSTTTDNVGLFGYTGSAAEIKNLDLEAVNIIGNNKIGGLVGNNNGAITSCYADGKVAGNSYVGGLAGNNNGSITYCYAASSVSGTDRSSYDIGGLAGGNSGTVTSCHATGSATVADKGSYDVGGLVGYNNYGTIISCYATGSVTGSFNIGGLVGENYNSAITSCYATGSVIGTDSWIGGLVGYNWQDYGVSCITSCYATGSVIGSFNIGGLVGENYKAKVTQCYSIGKPTGTLKVGGLCGSISIGSDYEDTGNFWDTQTSQMPTSAMGSGKTTAQMKTLLTFTNAGWDFTNVWQMPSNYYPKLVWETVVPNVVGMTQSAAAAAITSVDNLTVGTISLAYSNTVTAGLVASQNPVGGTSVNTGLSVNLVISLGKPVVPNVVNMTQAAAAAAVTAVDSLNVGTVRHAYSNTVTAGLVISQNPVGGTSVNTGSSVDLVISQGPTSPITVQKCSVAAGKYNQDSISISGLFDAGEGDFIDAMNGNVEVTIDSDTMLSSRTFAFQITPVTYKKSKFSGKDSNGSFKFDTKKQKFTFAVKKTDLTGLSCPFTVTITIGNYAAQAELGEPIVNGIKKLCPFQLMMGVQNNLQVTKYKLKLGKTVGTDTLAVQGTFTIDGNIDLSKPVVIGISSQTFTVPGISFIEKNGVYSCKNILTADGGTVSIKLDMNKCTFTLIVTKASIPDFGVSNFNLSLFGHSL